jgi:hypothetical protein
VTEPRRPLIPAEAQPGLIKAASWLNQAREHSFAARLIEASNPAASALPVAASRQ